MPSLRITARQRLVSPSVATTLRTAAALRRQARSCSSPSARRLARRTHRPSSSGKCVNTCRTTPAPPPACRRMRAVAGCRPSRALYRRASRIEIRRPRRRRHFGHAAEQALRRARAHQHDSRRRGRRRRRRRAGARLRASAPWRGKVSGVAARMRRAVLVPGAERAGRLLRRADGGAEIHHRLGEIAGARSRRQRRARARGSRGLAPGSGVSTAKSRAITRSTLPSTGVAGASKAIAAIGGRRVVADAGQRAQLGLRSSGKRRRGARPRLARRRAGCGRGRNSRGRPRPSARRRSGAAASRATVGPAGEEARVIGLDRPHRGLLQHDLGEPDPVGIGASRPVGARHGSVAAMAVVPGEQRGGIVLRARSHDAPRLGAPGLLSGRDASAAGLFLFRRPGAC